MSSFQSHSVTSFLGSTTASVWPCFGEFCFLSIFPLPTWVHDCLYPFLFRTKNLFCFFHLNLDILIFDFEEKTVSHFYRFSKILTRSVLFERLIPDLCWFRNWSSMLLLGGKADGDTLSLGAPSPPPLSQIKVKFIDCYCHGRCCLME